MTSTVSTNSWRHPAADFPSLYYSSTSWNINLPYLIGRKNSVERLASAGSDEHRLPLVSSPGANRHTLGTNRLGPQPTRFLPRRLARVGRRRIFSAGNPESGCFLRGDRPTLGVGDSSRPAPAFPPVASPRCPATHRLDRGLLSLRRGPVQPPRSASEPTGPPCLGGKSGRVRPRKLVCDYCKIIPGGPD